MRNTILNICGQVGIMVRCVVLIFFLSFITLSESSATHIIGGNMSYKCLGNDMYEITLIIMRDCYEGHDDAPHDQPEVYLSIFDGNGGFFPRRGDNGHIRLPIISLDTMDIDLEKFCFEGINEVCVSPALYRGIVCLPYEKSGYIISYQRCCRNHTLSNIIDPLETGGTWKVDILPEAQTECNSNPVFKSWPPVYICQNDPLVYDHSAVDPDGDSLVYSLCTPHSGATRAIPRPGRASNPPYDSVTWKAPYNRLDMMGGVPLTIDPATGIMTATPDSVGQYLIGVMVEEYRNGQLIGFEIRDFEFNVRPCGEKPEADFEVLTDKCDGLKQSFKNTSVDVSKSTWYFDYPRRMPSSMEENPMHTYDSVGTYDVMLIVENDEGCLDSILKRIEVLDPMLNPSFEMDLECQDSLKLYITNTSTSKDSIVSYMWTLDYPGGSLTSDDKDPVFCLTTGGKVTVQLKITDINGCMDSVTKMIEVEDLPLEFIKDTFEICLGDEIRLLANGDPSLYYTWTPTDGLKLDPPHDPRACPTVTTTYCVTVTDSICSKTGCVHVIVTDTLEISLMGTDSTCTGDVMLMAVVDSGVLVEWSLDPDFDDIIHVGDKLNYVIDKTTKFYARAGGEDEPCPGIASKTVIFFDAIDENIDTRRVICFGPGMIELNPGGNEDYTYSWSPGKYLDDSTIANPKAMLDSTVCFSVAILNPEHPECPDTIEVKVYVGDSLYILGLPSDTILCDTTPVNLSVTTVPGDLKVTWCDSAGNQLAVGHDVMIDPVGLDIIIVKAEDTLGCIVRDTMNITLYEIDVKITGTDSICLGDTAMVMLTGLGSDSFDVEWSPINKILGAGLDTIIKAVLDTTTKFTVTISNGKGCVWERMYTVYVGGFYTGVVATADPMEINPGEMTMLNAEADSVVSYMWRGEGLSDPNIQDPKAMLNEPGMYTYTVKVTDKMGCMDSASVVVKVRMPDCIDGVFLPNAFSPNGDGHNDLLYVRSLFIQDMTLSIFDRWGEEVFFTNSQSIPWDGTYKGKKLPPDVYGYYLEYRCIDGEDYVKKGNVTLLR